MIDPKVVVDFLNELVELDREAIERLIEYRVTCNETLAKHPTVQVTTDGAPTVGLLGLLNGLCGVDAEGWGFIAAQFSSIPPGKLIRFVVRQGR